MRPEAASAGGTHAASMTPGGLGRLLRFLLLSVALHALLATALPSEVPAAAQVGITPSVSAPVATELVWLESTGEARGTPRASEEPRSDAAVTARPVRERKRAPRVEPPPRSPGAVEEAPAPTPAAPPPAAPAAVDAVAEALARESLAGHPGAEPTSPGGSAGAVSPGGGAGSQGEGAPGRGGVGTGAPVDLAAYARRLSSEVARQQRYPAIAARMGMAGTARIRIRLHREGSLAGPPHLVRSSGHEVLDAEALRMVEAAAPFAPLPEGFSRPHAELLIPVEFVPPRPGRGR